MHKGNKGFKLLRYGFPFGKDLYQSINQYIPWRFTCLSEVLDLKLGGKKF